ncbi:MAG: 4a-hydroxytetrahydrobiopterin dehydratase [Mariniflexile sp.]|jgi:4a-hydroxytetrahydrobiopterin dehydratase
MNVYNEVTAQPILKDLNEWKFNDNGIEKKFVFKNFSQALSFIVQVGILAEKQGHHPELFNVYNKVNIRLATHDAGGLTDKDFTLAKAIELL